MPEIQKASALGRDNGGDEIFAGWEQYPANVQDFNPVLQDSAYYQERLQSLSRVLLSDRVALRVIDAESAHDFKAEGENLSGASKVENYFSRKQPSLRIISIARKHSMLNFRISKEVLCKILTAHDVGPVFLDLLFGLRAREEMSEKGFGVWEAGSTGRGHGHYEICYQMRYVERNDHQQGRQWSERQVGVYHRFSTTSPDPAVMLLLHAMPNSRLQQRLDGVFSQGQYQQSQPLSPMLLHALIISTYLDQWRWYMDDLGSTCLRLENEGFTAELKSKEDRSLSFQTLQELRNMESIFLTMSTIFRATLATLDRLQKVCEELQREGPLRLADTGSCDLKTSKEQTTLRALSQRCRSYSNSVEIMQNRAGKLIELLADGLNQKSQGTSAEISSSLLALTKRSVDDNVTVRVVTIITLIYLPTQFAASFFGTNFIVFDTNVNRIRFAMDFWIFLAVAVPLTILTLSIWFVSTRKEKHEKARGAEVLEKAEQFEDP